MSLSHVFLTSCASNRRTFPSDAEGFASDMVHNARAGMVRLLAEKTISWDIILHSEQKTAWRWFVSKTAAVMLSWLPGWKTSLNAVKTVRRASPTSSMLPTIRKSNPLFTTLLLIPSYQLIFTGDQVFANTGAELCMPALLSVSWPP